MRTRHSWRAACEASSTCASQAHWRRRSWSRAPPHNTEASTKASAILTLVVGTIAHTDSLHNKKARTTPPSTTMTGDRQHIGAPVHSIFGATLPMRVRFAHAWRLLGAGGGPDVEVLQDEVALAVEIGLSSKRTKRRPMRCVDLPTPKEQRQEGGKASTTSPSATWVPNSSRNHFSLLEIASANHTLCLENHADILMASLQLMRTCSRSLPRMRKSCTFVPSLGLRTR